MAVNETEYVAAIIADLDLTDWEGSGAAERGLAPSY
jgi:hypothetical protein